jgi:2-dehydropantoate 2-reductase
MRIAIFGSGGVGGYFGGRLAQAGEDVFFIARGKHLETLREQGLQVDSLQGDFRVTPVQATANPGEVGPVEIVLLATKAWQVPEAAAAMRPMLGGDTGVVWLGNGVEAPDQLCETLGAEHVLGGLTRISATLAGPGHIRHVGIDPFIAFGELDGGRSARVEALFQAFQRCQGLTVNVPDDILAAMWDKFVFISAISGVGAVTRAPSGVIRGVPETRHMLEAAIAETTQLARARGVRLPANQVEKTMTFIDQMAPGVLASMQRDIMEGRPSELEAQNGAVVRMGRAVGTPTPVHDLLYASLLPQERKARGAL